MLKVDWQEWGRALDVFMWEAIALTLRLPERDFARLGLREWPPHSIRLIPLGGQNDEYAARLRKATHQFRGSTQAAHASPYPGNPEWRVVAMPEFGAWAVGEGWAVPDDFPWAEKPEFLDTKKEGRDRGMPVIGRASVSTNRSSPEQTDERQRRRLDRLQALGGDRRHQPGGTWKASGTRGALAALAREEAEAGRPYSDVRDVARDLDAEAVRRRASRAMPRG